MYCSDSSAPPYFPNAKHNKASPNHNPAGLSIVLQQQPDSQRRKETDFSKSRATLHQSQCTARVPAAGFTLVFAASSAPGASACSLASSRAAASSCRQNNLRMIAHETALIIPHSLGKSQINSEHKSIDQCNEICQVITGTCCG